MNLMGIKVLDRVKIVSSSIHVCEFILEKIVVESKQILFFIAALKYEQTLSTY